MRRFAIVFSSFSLLFFSSLGAGDRQPLDYQFLFAIERAALDGVTLGSDQTADRLVEENYELEFSLDYQVRDNLLLFFTGALIDETETLETVTRRERTSGLEFKEIGVSYWFGDTVDSVLQLGRIEFVSISEWWLWWDEELDAISLNSSYANFNSTLSLAQPQARENSNDRFIDPEVDDIKRILWNLSWEFGVSQSLNFYYLRQEDNSTSYYNGFGSFEDCNDGPPAPICVSENADAIDEEDAELSWTGVSYLGEFDTAKIGEFDIELHLSRVSGDEIVYEFDDPDPTTGLSEVTSRLEQRVSGTAQSFLIDWTPAGLDHWSLVFGKASGSTDRNPDNNHDRSFRQTGLQGESTTFGELYQPEISNISVDLIGIEWEISDGIELAILGYDFRQQQRADELRDVAIDTELTGLSRDLGREVDVIITIETHRGLEIIVTAAEFEAGDAYGAFANETSNFINFELEYAF